MVGHIAASHWNNGGNRLYGLNATFFLGGGCGGAGAGAGVLRGTGPAGGIRRNYEAQQEANSSQGLHGLRNFWSSSSSPNLT